MRESDYEFIRQLVYQHSRINLGPDKRELVSARLGKRLRATNLTSISDYCRFLQERESEEELSHLIDAISTNHTYFFREQEHFDFLRDVVLPEMTLRRQTEQWKDFCIWSAACSSGEEPYSIAMLLAQRLGLHSPWNWRVEATDISHQVLQRARVGIYKAETVEKLPSEWVRLYFQRGFGPQEGNFRVKPQLQETVTFRQLNLLGERTPFPHPHPVIFCRNVMIYFDRATQEELINKFTRLLLPGGYLFVGHSESLAGVHHSLEMISPAIYRKPKAA